MLRSERGAVDRQPQPRRLTGGLKTVDSVKRTSTRSVAAVQRHRKAHIKPAVGVGQVLVKTARHAAAGRSNRRGPARRHVPQRRDQGAPRASQLQPDPDLEPELEPHQEPEPEPEQELPEVAVELFFRRGGVLGLDFNSSWTVVGIEPGSLAASQPPVLDGRLQLGMQLVRIGSEGVWHDQGDLRVFGALHNAGLPVCLGFAEATVTDSTSETSTEARCVQDIPLDQPEALTRKQAAAEERLAQLETEHEAVLAAAIATGKDAAAVSIKMGKEQQRAQTLVNLETQAVECVVEGAKSWNTKPLPYLAMSALQLTVRESASLDSPCCGVLEPRRRVVVTRRAVAMVAPIAGKLAPQPLIVVRLEFKLVGNDSTVPQRGWVSVEHTAPFIAIDDHTDGQHIIDAEAAKYNSSMLAAAEETRPAEGVDVQPNADVLQKHDSDGTDKVTDTSAIDALSPTAQRLIAAAKEEDEVVSVSEAAAVGHGSGDDPARVVTQLDPEPQLEPEPEAFRTTDAEIEYALGSVGNSDKEQDAAANAALLDELAALEAELQEFGDDSMTETESVYGTQTSVPQIGSTADDAEQHDSARQKREQELLSETGRLRMELAAIEAEIKAGGKVDDEVDEEQVDEAAEAEDEFCVDDELEDDLEHELQAEEDHQFMLISFRSALPVYPRKVLPSQPVREYTFPQLLTRLCVGQWSDSDAVELAWPGSYGKEETRLIEVTASIRRKNLIKSAVLRLQRGFRMQIAKQVVAEKRAQSYAARKIQSRFRGRTARVSAEELRGQLGSNIFNHITQFDKDSNGFIDANEFKMYIQVVG